MQLPFAGKLQSHTVFSRENHALPNFHPFDDIILNLRLDP